MVLYMPRARQQKFYITSFSCFRFQYNGLRYDLALTDARLFCYSEGKRLDTSQALILTVYNQCYGSQAVELS